MNYTNITIAFGFVLLIAIALRLNNRRNKKKKPVPIKETRTVTIGSAPGRDFKTVKEFFDSLPPDMSQSPIAYQADIYDDARPANAQVIKVTGQHEEGKVHIRPAVAAKLEPRRKSEKE